MPLAPIRHRISGHVQKRPDHSARRFLTRTVAAQTHLFGAVAAIICATHLITIASMHPSDAHFWGAVVFGLTGTFVFIASALYHFLLDGFLISPPLRVALEKLDQYAIYFFIAGSYTPILLNTVADPWRTRLLISLYVMAIGGSLYTHYRHRFPRWAQTRFVYTLVFVLMGWASMLRLSEIVSALDAFGRLMLLLIAAAYTLGAVVYVTKRPKLFAGTFGFHELWHIMVMMGYAFTYALILSFYVG